MKPIYLQKNTQSGEQSFDLKYAIVPYTYNQYHFHKEFELMFNIKSSGTRFVGDSINRYNDGDLVLVGPNIPHYWHSDDKYFLKDPKIKARVVVAQFIKDFMGASFLELPEMHPIKDLFYRAERGIQIRGREAEIIGKKMIALPKKNGKDRLLSLIDILCLMGEAPDYKILASEGFCENYKAENNERISLIFNYMIKNCHKNIDFKEVANLAHMNPSAFCRYFKRATSKTFSELLNEVRVGLACKMLINSNDTISEIGYTCGYMNIPYFNRQFKGIKKVTPAQYRQLYAKKNLINE